jgi:hypothetical protein
MEHRPEDRRERRRALNSLAQLPLPFLRLLGQTVANFRLVAHHFAGPGDLEPLGGALVSLLLGQGLLLFIFVYVSSRRSGSAAKDARF